MKERSDQACELAAIEDSTRSKSFGDGLTLPHDAQAILPVQKEPKLGAAQSVEPAVASPE